MELYALFIVFIGLTSGQDAPNLRVTFENTAARQVSVDEHLSFVCHINRDVMYALVNFVEIVRKSAVDGSEVILTQAAKRVHAEPAFYNVKVGSTDQNTIKVEFEILKVRDIDEGQLICRARPGEEGGESAESSVEILVKRPLDSLHLKFASFDAISVSVTDPIEVDSGNYSVQCIAEGSNPAPADVSLYLHGSEVPTTPHTERMDADVIKYRTVITGTVQLKATNANHEIECSAASHLGDSRSVKLPIKLKLYDPKIVCNSTKAYVGQWYPVLTCVVDYEGLNIKRFKYELGNKDSVPEGTQNKDFVEVKREQLSDTMARVVLNLYQAKDWHFNTEFYLVAEHEDGRISRADVRLEREPENVTVEWSEPGPQGNSVGLLTASLATVVTSVWWAHQLAL